MRPKPLQLTQLGLLAALYLTMLLIFFPIAYLFVFSFKNNAQIYANFWALPNPWIVGNFMPFITFGAAVGRADFSRSATVSGTQNPFSPFDPTLCPSAAHPTCAQFSFPNSESKKGALIYGWAAGGGADVMILPHVFLRGEFEYVHFAPLSGIVAAIASGRVGAGVQF